MPIRKWIAVYLVILFMAVMTSGCLGARTPTAVSPTLPVVLLDYHRTGGVAGVDDRLVIFDNGAALISTRSVNREFQVNSSELERLKRIFEQAGYVTLQENYTSPYNGADFMRYSITYQGKTLTTEDTVIPYPLQPIIRELNAVISAAHTIDPAAGYLPSIRT